MEAELQTVIGRKARGDDAYGDRPGFEGEEEKATSITAQHVKPKA